MLIRARIHQEQLLKSPEVVACFPDRNVQSLVWSRFAKRFSPFQAPRRPSEQPSDKNIFPTPTMPSSLRSKRAPFPLQVRTLHHFDIMHKNVL